MMKHSCGDVKTSQNCPCTSRMYRVESYQPSVDLRTQLLLDNNIGIIENADLKPILNRPVAYGDRKLDDDAKKKSSTEKLVHFDGDCCRCGSKIHLHEHKCRVHRDNLIDKVTPPNHERTSSNFIFNIGFSKDDRGANNFYDNSKITGFYDNSKITGTRPTLKIKKTSKRDKSLNKRIDYLAHKQSFITSSNYTVKKNNLPRCFYTLEPTKPHSIRTLTSGQSIPKTVEPNPEFMEKQDHKRNRSLKVDIDKDLKQRCFKDSKSIRHQKPRVIVPHDEKSTKVGSFISRCLCTTQLHTQKKIQKVSPTFLNKCVTAVKPNPEKAETSTSAKSKHQNAQNSDYAQTKINKEKRAERGFITLNLDPYERKPKVCVPGECAPRVCEERVRKRKANLDKMSSKDGNFIGSTSTLLQSPETTKSTVTNTLMQNIDEKSKSQVSLSEKRSKSAKQSDALVGLNLVSLNADNFREKKPSFGGVQSVYFQTAAKQTQYYCECKALAPKGKRGENPAKVVRNCPHIKSSNEQPGKKTS